ncbi:MAG: hypothetical protein GWO26_19535, partial [Phycisphaerae bacterium]|nr:hypothetical protein [Phycisphaerae bacterium]
MSAEKLTAENNWGLTSDGDLDQLDRATDAIKARGFYRVQIEEDGKIVGDSGWHENQVVNLGFNQYLVLSLMGDGSAKNVTHVALGTGTEPGAAATSLEGELEQTSSRAAVTTATSSSSKRARFTATFASNSSFVSTTMTLKNIGLFNTSAATTGTIFSGNTYATSTCATNQNVNIT